MVFRDLLHITILTMQNQDPRHICCYSSYYTTLDNLVRVHLLGERVIVPLLSLHPHKRSRCVDAESHLTSQSLLFLLFHLVRYLTNRRTSRTAVDGAGRGHGPDQLVVITPLCQDGTELDRRPTLRL